MNIALFREYQINKSGQYEMVTGGPCLMLIKGLLSGWDYEKLWKQESYIHQHAQLIKLVSLANN